MKYVGNEYSNLRLFTYRMDFLNCDIVCRYPSVFIWGEYGLDMIKQEYSIFLNLIFLCVPFALLLVVVEYIFIYKMLFKFTPTCNCKVFCFVFFHHDNTNI